MTLCSPCARAGSFTNCRRSGSARRSRTCRPASTEQVRRDQWLVTAHDYLSIVQAAFATVSMSLVSIVLGVPLGLGLALIRWSRLPLLSRVTIVYVSIIRTCPSVTLALLIFFALPEVGISLDPVPAGILTLTLSTAAFNTEIWRSALMNFPRD